MSLNIKTKTLLALSVLVICDAVIIKEVLKWFYINYTWPTPVIYQYYLQTNKYIPENNIPSNIKIHRNLAFITLGRYFPGTPVTLGYVKLNDVSSLVTPYPNWDFNVQSDCTTLQNVNAIDIDKNGIMWILDGLRINTLTKCPPKLILFNITSSKIRSVHEFPTEGDRNHAYLFDLVVDGNLAYISDSNAMDPGIIVYSKEKNTSWKLRDSSMFPDLKGVKFSTGNYKYNYYHGVGPITMTPSSKSKKPRFIFYSPVSSQIIYKLNVNFIQNIDNVVGGTWRDYVHIVGAKVDQSYNYAMKSNGELFFCLMNKNALAKWNIGKDFRTASYVVQNNSMIQWCSGSTFDNDNLYIISGNLVEYLMTNVKPTMQKNLFRLLKISTSGKTKRNSNP